MYRIQFYFFLIFLCLATFPPVFIFLKKFRHAYNEKLVNFVNELFKLQETIGKLDCIQSSRVDRN